MNTVAALLAVSTFCNPVSLPEIPVGYICRDLPNGSPLSSDTNSWMYIFWKRGAACQFDETHQFRETADPVVYAEGNRWYLYPSLGLLWTSDDCGGTWKRVPERDHGEYAPAVAKFRGKYYLCTSGGPLSVSERPEGPFRELGSFDLASFGSDPEMPGTLDPALLADGDSLYLYWGCCAKPKSLWGVELDPDNPLKARKAGSAVCLMEYDERRYPWLNELIEGCWVFKRGDTYYLTYSTDNTCGPRYGWCASKGKHPLGPFVPQKKNPFFVTETGLVTGTGHGSIWKDAADRWWINSCTVVGAYHGFERLLVQDRLFFEADGDIRVGHASETPQWLPCSGKEGPTGWQALPLATSAKGAVDNRLSTWSEVGRETVFELDGASTLEAARLIWRDLGLDVKRGIRPGPYRYRLDVRVDGTWRPWIDASANATDLYVDYREGGEVTANAVRLTVLGAPKGITPALTEFTVFGMPRQP